MIVTKTNAEKIARLERENAELRALVGDQRGTVERLRRELQEWKRGHWIRDRKRPGRTKASATAGER